MKVATTMPRYDKFQRLLINDQEITLIDHLKQLREANKITKKKISNLIKTMIHGIPKSSVMEKMEMIIDNVPSIVTT